MELQQNQDAFAAQGVKVVAVTTDDISVSSSVARQLKLGYPILVDRLGTLGAAFGVFQSSGHMGSTDQHAMFVIDSAGIIRWKEISPSMHVPIADVLRAAEAAA